MSPDDPVTITVRRQTLQNVTIMIPNAKLLRNEFLMAAVDFLAAIDNALVCDVHADMKEEDEEEPAYEPPR